MICRHASFLPAFLSWTNFVRCVKASHLLCCSDWLLCFVSRDIVVFARLARLPATTVLFRAEFSGASSWQTRGEVLGVRIEEHHTEHLPLKSVQKLFCYSSYAFWNTCWVPQPSAQCAKAFTADDWTYTAPLCACHLLKGSQMIRPNLSSCTDLILWCQKLRLVNDEAEG